MTLLGKEKKSQKIVIAAIAALCFISLICFLAGGLGRKRVFYFQSMDTGRLITETRYVPRKPVQGKVRLFVDELLLGPLTSRARPIFSPGTTVNFCFVQKHTLYVDFSDTLLSVAGDASEIRKGTEIFRKNILMNFGSIYTVKMFIGGKEIYKYDKA